MMSMNVGVCVLNGFCVLWQLLIDFVDVGMSVFVVGGFLVVVLLLWIGFLNDGMLGGMVLNLVVLNVNVQYVVDVMLQCIVVQVEVVYYDDCCGKGYSVLDGMGLFIDVWCGVVQQMMSIMLVLVDVMMKFYNDMGNNIGVGGSVNVGFGFVVDFINMMGNNGLMELVKCFYKYVCLYWWSMSVVVVLMFVLVESIMLVMDGGFLSGYFVEGMCDVFVMVYVIFECFQEMISCGFEFGENCIFVGMYLLFDVIGGWIFVQVVVVVNFVDLVNVMFKQMVFQQVYVMLYLLICIMLVMFLVVVYVGMVLSDCFVDLVVNWVNYVC